jgi:alkylated DNA repair dioxygenase AlkB
MPTAQRDLFGAPGALPPGLVYAADFITAAEESHLLGFIATLPLHEARYKEYTAKRRIASFGAEYDFGQNRLLPGPDLPEALHPLRAKVAAWVGIEPGAFRHGLVTEYRDGTALGWHRDVPDFEGVVGVSLAGPARMRWRPYPPGDDWKARVIALDLEPRSAYVMRGDARWRWQHSIPATKNLRYSITFRTSAGRKARR